MYMILGTECIAKLYEKKKNEFLLSQVEAKLNF